MDREIKFRGKRIDNVEWVYGLLVNTIDGFAIFPKKIEWADGCEWRVTNFDFVDSSTVGQYTGLHDKKGTSIYEGDIGWDDQNECYGVVEFSDGNFSYVWENICTDLFEISNDIEIVGNIHDNPELSQKQ